MHRIWQNFSSSVERILEHLIREEFIWIVMTGVELEPMHHSYLEMSGDVGKTTYI